jgi:hypothetical protein
MLSASLVVISSTTASSSGGVQMNLVLPPCPNVVVESLMKRKSVYYLYSKTRLAMAFFVLTSHAGDAGRFGRHQNSGKGTSA